jgi:hypothetical protein
MSLNGNNGSATNSDDVKRGGVDVLDEVLGIAGRAAARGIEGRIKSLEKLLMSRAERIGSKGTLVVKRAPNKRQQPPQLNTPPSPGVSSAPPLPRRKSGAVAGAISNSKKSKVVTFDQIVGNVYWPAAGTNGGWESTPVRFCPVSTFPRMYEEGKEFRTYRVLKLRVEMIPNDPGVKDGVYNGTWGIVPSYSYTPMTVNNIEEVECSGGVFGTTNAKLSYSFDVERISSRDLQIPKQGYTPSYDNTSASFTIVTQRATGSNVTDYTVFGKWRVVATIMYMDPQCTADRFGNLSAYFSGVAAATPLGTTLTGFQTAGYLWGSVVDVANKKVYLYGLQIGDSISVILEFFGASAAYSYSFTDVTVAGLSTSQDLELASASTYGYCFNPPAATGTKFMVRYRFLATATYATLTWGTASTFPGAPCAGSLTVSLDGNDRNVVQMRSSVMQSVGSGHVNDPSCPMALRRRTERSLQIDINPPPLPPTPLPPLPPDPLGSGCDFIAPVLCDTDCEGSEPPEALTAEEWEYIRAMRGDSRGK